MENNNYWAVGLPIDTDTDIDIDMLLTSEEIDELAKMKIELIDMIFELNNHKSFVDYGKKYENNTERNLDE